jgi:hypothetical protein
MAGRFQSDDQRGVVNLTFHVTVTDSASIHTGKLDADGISRELPAVSFRKDYKA